MQVCIGLCVYKNEFGLPFIFKNIERIQTLFPEKKIQIIVAYEESADCSLGILISKLSEFDIHIMKNDNTEKYMYPNGYIANARNQILHYIRENILLTKYLIMMDSNEYACVGDISLDVLKEAFIRETEWDAVSFDREAGYYDYWALSLDPFIYTDDSDSVLDKMKIQLKNAREKNAFVNVYSAFNGFAIYKWSIFKDCKYSIDIDLSLFPDQTLERQLDVFKNEHRHFHLQAIKTKNARIRIYPKSLFAKFQGEKMKNCQGPC